MAESPYENLRVPTPSSVMLLRRTMERVEGWPVAGRAVKRVRRMEDWAVAELQRRMDEFQETSQMQAAQAIGDARERARAVMSGLLNEADERSLDQVSERQYLWVLEQLSPDQAKMLAALVDGRVFPLIHIGAGLPAGPIRENVLENATNLGREAGIALRQRVPFLVGQMRGLGLLHIGPQDKSLETAYEVLAADTIVRETNTYIKETMGMWPRAQRHTLSLSTFGREFWEFASPGVP